MLHLLLQTFWPWQNGKILCIYHFILFWILWNLVFGIFWPKFWNLGLKPNLYCRLKLICVPFIVANILAFTELKILCISHFIPFWIWWNLVFGIYWPKFWNLGLEPNLYCPLKLICVPIIVPNILSFTEWKILCISHFIPFWILWNLVFVIFLDQNLKFGPETEFILPT